MTKEIFTVLAMLRIHSVNSPQVATLKYMVVIKENCKCLRMKSCIYPMCRTFIILYSNSYRSYPFMEGSPFLLKLFGQEIVCVYTSDSMYVSFKKA